MESGILTATPKGHFSNIEDPRLILDPYLQAWELDHALKIGKRNVTFKYQNAKIIDRNPPNPGVDVAVPVTGIEAIGVVERV